MSSKTATQRLEALRELLLAGEISTQEGLVQELRHRKFVVTQSTISRDLTRLGAIRARDASGAVVYRLSEEGGSALPIRASNLKGLLTGIEHNGTMIVIKTTPGSASLVARQLDQTRPEGILGTIAGDDTIFVAPSSIKKIQATMAAILEEFT